MKKGTEFELLVKAIYEEIHSQDSLENVTVEHDVRVVGRSGQAHQIDVYWEFISAGVTHRVAVECKEYKNTVSVGKVRDFYGALDDIGNIHGVFVTTKGYQAGAITFAEHQGISLKTVSDPTDKELGECLEIKTLVMRGRALCIANVELTPILDVKWIIENTELNEGDEFNFSGVNNEIKVLDKNYNSQGTILDFENKLPRSPENESGLSRTYEFEDSFIHIPDSGYPPLKISALRYNYDTYTMSMESVTKFKAIAKAVLRDIITGESHLYNQATHITRPSI
jgi:hypothetical protein